MKEFYLVADVVISSLNTESLPQYNIEQYLKIPVRNNTSFPVTTFK
jgi:hypothetical protein